MSKGILYVASGKEFVEEAHQSASSAKEMMPNISITLITDQEVDTKLFDNVLQMDDPRGDGGDRIINMLRSPYDQTLFVDTDIYFVDNIVNIYKLLENFDLAVSLNGEFFKSTKHNSDQIPKSFPEFNGGVILYNNNEQVHNFQAKWESEFLTNSNNIEYNQPSLRQSLYETDLRFTVLPRNYNCIFRRPGHVCNKVKILHGRLLDIDSYGAPKTFNINKVKEKINANSNPRVYYPKGRSIAVRPNLLDRLRYSIYSKGIKETTKKVVNKYNIFDM